MAYPVQYFMSFVVLVKPAKINENHLPGPNIFTGSYSAVASYVPKQACKWLITMEMGDRSWYKINCCSAICELTARLHGLSKHADGG